MDARPTSAPDPATFNANLAALERFQPQTAARLRQAEPPPSFRPATGRDGRPTYVWSESDGQLRWLGRTSMPSVSATALVDAFQPGNRNVLLAGLGQGAEARLLLDRLAPHQALMVVEEHAWTAALSLRLYDFSDAFRTGRLLLFVGPDCWTELRDFLCSAGGYLTPERMISWPWFDAKAVSEVSTRLLEINRYVAQQRSQTHAERSKNPPARSSYTRTPTIALVSNVVQSSVTRLADRLAAAAQSLERPCVRFVLDDPTMVHPSAIQEALFKASPAVVILLDVSPPSLQYELPPVPSFILCAHRQALSDDWVRELPPTTRLGVPTEKQRRQVIELGLGASRVMLLPPAARPGQTGGSPVTGSRILVLADGADTRAEAVGLHLNSHCQLWDAAEEIILERCDTYRDDQAAEVLDAAERKLTIRLDSDDVRAGLVNRIQRILGPAITRQACCAALIEAGIDFDLYGNGWPSESAASRHLRGPWPEAPAIRDLVKNHGLVIMFETSGLVRSALLDGLTSGLAAVVRAHPLDDTVDGLAGVLDPEKHLHRFVSRADLVKSVRRFGQMPDEFRAKAAAAAEHIRSRHMWTHRLQAILEACEAS